MYRSNMRRDRRLARKGQKRQKRELVRHINSFQVRSELVLANLGIGVKDPLTEVSAPMPIRIYLYAIIQLMMYKVYYTFFARRFKRPFTLSMFAFKSSKL